MKKNLLAIGLGSLFVISGCAAKHDNHNSMENNTVDPIGVRAPANYYNEDNRNLNKKTDDFGFTRVDKKIVNGKNINNQISSIDREQLADVISRLCIQLPNIKDVSTLVTDEEVLVVYDTDSKNRDKAADQVKRTAMSAVPRYYHVYVSDNTALTQNIENYAPLQSDSQGIDYSIEKTIKEMLKSPQGYKMNNEENENGENINEQNNNKNIHEKTKRM